MIVRTQDWVKLDPPNSPKVWSVPQWNQAIWGSGVPICGVIHGVYGKNNLSAKKTKNAGNKQAGAGEAPVLFFSRGRGVKPPPPPHHHHHNYHHSTPGIMVQVTR